MIPKNHSATTRISRRNEIELAIEQLVAKKLELTEDDYFRQLEVLMVKLARVYEGK